MEKNDGLVNIEIGLNRETHAFIQSVASNAGVTKDQAASVIAVLSVSRYLGIPLLDDELPRTDHEQG